MHRDDPDRNLAALASLGDPLRRALYRLACERDGGVGRDEAAAAVGVSRALAAYHLDKLAEAGLLETRFERRTGRRGPGAGRTAKLYLRAATPIEVALPARDYRRMAGLLAEAVEADPSGAARAGLARAARSAGAEAARRAGTDTAGQRPGPDEQARRLLADQGYEPYREAGVVRLRNCPFEQLTRAHRELVCQANLAFVEGLVEHLRGGGLRARLDPGPGRCCVVLA
jgi:predicted ArsR family transcriptional regulator